MRLLAPINLPGIAICLFALLLSLLAQAETATLQYDNNGNITQRIWVKGKTTQTTTFTYDALNRLIGESGPAKTQTITYDENGNRKSDGAGSYTYETGSNRMLTRRGLSVTTDSLGNITADGTGRTYGFNQANQLYQVFQNGTLIATYEYDTNGLRLSKTTTASAPQGVQTVVYHYDLDGRLIAETTATGSPLRAYIWRDDTPVAQIEYVPSRKIYYFEADHLNTPRALMDDTGKVVWRWESDAFGSTLPNEDADGDGVKITSNLRFAGQYYDQETGLHYNWHRYYDPSSGQYIQADPVGLAAGTNLYAFVNSNPLSYTDSSGLSRNPRNGNWQPQSPSPAKPTPPPDPAATMTEKNSKAQDLLEGAKQLACQLGIMSCIPDESYVCLKAECIDSCGKPFTIDYQSKEPMLRDLDKPYPPTPAGTPDGCRCIQTGIRSGSPEAPPGL